MPEPSLAEAALRPDSHRLRALWFLVPGDLDTPTGGYRYDRRILEGLRSLGRRVEHRTLDASFPQPTQAARDQAHGILAGIPKGQTVVVDGLAFGALPELAELHGRRLDLIALVHHPLWLETGLDRKQAAALRSSETRALVHARRVIVTSPATGRLLQEAGVAACRVRIVAPGVDPAPAATGSMGPGVRLLCVATLTPRKGHDVLLRALSALAHLPWHLHCVGSQDRDPQWASELYRLRRDLGLDERVWFRGALDQAELDQRYAESDLFILPTRFEGYGMVVAEALARGLPIVATRTGALPDLVPPQAGTLVPPDEPAALGDALERLVTDSGLRHRLAAGARAAGLKLPSWTDAARDFAAACRQIQAGDASG